MLPVFAIQPADEGADQRRPALLLHPRPTRVTRLRLRSRDGRRLLPLHFQPEGDAIRAELPVTALLDDRPLRWDVQIELDGSGVFEPLIGTTAGTGHRHFFQQTIDGHGISAYLSDSVSSLVLFTAPLQQHAQTVDVENTRAAFPMLLEQLPLQDDLVVFESFLGKAYAGNPRYIYEALRRMRPDLRCVWAYNGEAPIPGDPPRVKRGSTAYYRLLAQARYRVNNILFAAHGRKAETRYLQTWHGTPLKRLGYDIEVSGPEVDARENLYRESRAWTHLLSENGYSSTILARAFRHGGEVLEVGYPLADPLAGEAVDRRDILCRLGLPCDHRFVLYAPTWRDDRQVGHWRFDFDLRLDIDRVAAALQPDQVLLIRAHHLVSRGLQDRPLPSNVRDMSHVDDATDLCVIADVLVTDYSSIFFDFATTGRPILFYCYDMERYAKEVRGFYLDMEQDLPGPIARSNEELIELLSDLPTVQAAHAERYAAFRKRFCALNDGRAAERVVAAFFGPFPPSNRFTDERMSSGSDGTEAMPLARSCEDAQP